MSNKPFIYDMNFVREQSSKELFIALNIYYKILKPYNDKII